MLFAEYHAGRAFFNEVIIVFSKMKVNSGVNFLENIKKAKIFSILINIFKANS